MNCAWETRACIRESASSLVVLEAISSLGEGAAGREYGSETPEYEPRETGRYELAGDGCEAAVGIAVGDRPKATGLGTTRLGAEYVRAVVSITGSSGTNKEVDERIWSIVIIWVSVSNPCNGNSGTCVA